MSVVCLLCTSCGPTFRAHTPEELAQVSRAESITPGSQLRLSYLHAGDDALPRVIYVHGTPGSADGWMEFLTDPVPGFHAISVDRPGFGQSDPRGPITSFQQQADALEPLLIDRAGRWPILVGHSLGGPIVARLAAQHPDRVAGIIIIAGSLDPTLERPSLAQRIASSQFVRFFLPRTLDNCMAELAAAREQTTLLAPFLPAITCPVVILHGDSDKLVPFENILYARARFTGASDFRIVPLANQGHFIPWQRPDTIRAAVETLRVTH